MELRGQQDKEIGMPSSLGYNPPIRESSSKVSSSSLISPGVAAAAAGEGGGGDERRTDGTGNGPAILNPSSQTLDHHRHLLQQQQHPRHHHHLDQQPDPDPVPVAIAVGGGTVAAAAVVAGGSNYPRTPTTPKSSITIRYRECLKNHAASKGRHVVDGCGEFMSSGEEGTPEALKCAACDCHRNFHRKEVEGEPRPSAAANCYYCYDPNHKNICSTRAPPPAPPHAYPSHHHQPPQLGPPHLQQQQQQQQKFHLGLPTSPSMASIPPSMMMAYGSGGGGGGATESSSEDLNAYQSNDGGTTSQPPPPFALSKKRFRTKFTQYQKDRMSEFAEKLGWRMQKQDELDVQRFCDEVGVKRQVLKVWMHNNKHAMKNKQL